MKAVELNPEMFDKVAAAYVEKGGQTPEEAAISANAYIDAIDDMVEGAHFMLRTLGPVGGIVWTTKQGHSINAVIEAV